MAGFMRLVKSGRERASERVHLKRMTIFFHFIGQVYFVLFGGSEGEKGHKSWPGTAHFYSRRLHRD